MGVVHGGKSRLIQQAIEGVELEKSEKRIRRRQRLIFALAERQSKCSHELIQPAVKTVFGALTGSVVMVKTGKCRKCAKQVRVSVVVNQGEGSFDA